MRHLILYTSLLLLGCGCGGGSKDKSPEEKLPEEKPVAFSLKKEVSHPGSVESCHGVKVKFPAAQDMETMQYIVSIGINNGTTLAETSPETRSQIFQSCILQKVKSSP